MELESYYSDYRYIVIFSGSTEGLAFNLDMILTTSTNTRIDIEIKNLSQPTIARPVKVNTGICDTSVYYIRIINSSMTISPRFSLECLQHRLKIPCNLELLLQN